MKKSLLSLAVLALIATATQAQDDKAKSAPGTTFGVKAGIGFGNLVGKDDAGDRLDVEMAIKWNIGVNAEIPVGTDFFFQPGLSVQTKGAKRDERVGTVNYKQTVNLIYLDIPMNFIYKPRSGNGNFLLGFGPYVGFGIGGNVQLEGGGLDEKQDVEYRGTVKTSDDPDKVYFKRLDAGANVLAGYEFANRFSVAVNSQLGLININPEYEGVTNDKSKTRNIGFSLNFGYRFGR